MEVTVMDTRRLTREMLGAYRQYLCMEERSQGTIDKYMRDIQSFYRWLLDKPVTKEVVTGWKGYLQETGYAATTVNSMLAALNGLFRFLNWEDCRVRFLKIQRQMFRSATRELTQAEYKKLLAAAQGHRQHRLALLMETICSIGIRVSEVKYITVEAAQKGRADINLKGKIRTILLPEKLCRKLLKYAEKNKTVSGEIFLTGNGKSLSRRQIWGELKRLCKYTGVAPSKVFPHNLRHLFAATYYRSCKDIARLADMLGHSSIETTRIYLVTSGTEQRKYLNSLGLIS